MKRTIKMVVSYQCSVCKTKYTNKKSALKCEKRTMEEKVFQVGDTVRNISYRYCPTKGKEYTFSGKIVKIIGPEPADFEYEVKWLGGKRINHHIFVYEVTFSCPHCRKKDSVHYYTPEIYLPAPEITLH